MNNMTKSIHEHMLKQYGQKFGGMLAGMNIGTYVLLQTTKAGPAWMHAASVLIVVAGILVLGTRPKR